MNGQCKRLLVLEGLFLKMGPCNKGFIFIFYKRFFKEREFNQQNLFSLDIYHQSNINKDCTLIHDVLIIFPNGLKSIGRQVVYLNVI